MNLPNTPNAGELAGQNGWGTRPRKAPGRNVKLRVRDFVDVDQSEPLPIWYGTIRFAGTSLTPVFGLKSRDVAEGGK